MSTTRLSRCVGPLKPIQEHGFVDLKQLLGRAGIVDGFDDLIIRHVEGVRLTGI